MVVQGPAPRRRSVAGPRWAAAADRAQRTLRSLRQRADPARSASSRTDISRTAPPRGVAFLGTIWLGGQAEPAAGVLVVDGAGRIVRVDLSEDPVLSQDILTLGGPRHWVVPAVIDTHVHLDPERLPASRSGLGAVRDLGSPLPIALAHRSGRRTPAPNRGFVASCGPVLTAPGGYPARSRPGGWPDPAAGDLVTGAAQARSRVHYLAAAGVDLIGVALEPGSDSWPVPSPTVVQAIVEAAHACGLGVLAHARTVEMVTRALDAGVDELSHVPTERLPEHLVERIATAGVAVCSTVQSAFSSGTGRIAADNAADLVAAGARLVYGTDFGVAGSQPGVDPRELDRLAAAGLGRLGALRAATSEAAGVVGIRGRSGTLALGAPAALVLLTSDPLAEPGVWRSPAAVFCDGRLTVGPTGHEDDVGRQAVDRSRGDTGRADSPDTRTDHPSR